MSPSSASRVRVACTAVVVGVAASAACATVAAHARAGTAAKAQLPDMLQLAPYDLSGSSERTLGGLRFHLGFSSAVVNVGTGPLDVEGSRLDRSTATMTASQIVHWSNGSTKRYSGVGRLKFVISETHRHWHYLAFEQYQLLRASDGRVVRGDAKTGFCLGDRYNAFPGARTREDQPKKPVFVGSCEKNQPLARRVREGISVGYGDNYKPQVEGQYVDITGVPAGTYELLHKVNVDRKLRESSYANDAASILIQISWPRGFEQPPSIDVVKRCGDGRRCRGS
jgi:lysyl oxidase